MKIFVYINFLVLLIIFIFIFIYIPFFEITFANSNEKLTYFKITGIFFTCLIGLIGTAYGLFYYFDKKDFEISKIIADNKISQLNTLLRYLGEHNQLVSKILFKELKDDNELNLIRYNIRNKIELVYLMIDKCNMTMKLTDRDIAIISNYHAFVDKNYLIMEANHDEIKDENLSFLLEPVQDLLCEAQRVCLVS